MTKEIVCPVCDKKISETLIDFGEIPRSGVFLSSLESEFDTFSHSLKFCSECALICRHLEETLTPDYQKVDRSTEGQTPLYVKEILSNLQQMPGASNPHGLIIDVGGNDGSFLDLIAEIGFHNRLNIEPSIRLSKRCRSMGHKVENTHLTQNEASRIRQKYGAATTVFCRHVLEHVPNPAGFLASIHDLLLDDGILFIETPDSSGILHGFLGHELWDEHLYHYTTENLRRLLIQSGFEILQNAVKPHRGGTNILYWVQKKNRKKKSLFSPSQMRSDVKACIGFAKQWGTLSKEVCEKVSQAPKPIICLGASHPQTNYLLFTDIGKQIDFMVDDDPIKVGRYVSIPQLVKIISTNQLFEKDLPGMIIKTAFGCDGWMDRICQPMKEKGVFIMEPYLS
jgi:2-polyprenyl-3-methyl-5-hydroxy-6-metoxy-1,4-benzoquinol methylase